MSTEYLNEKRRPTLTIRPRTASDSSISSSETSLKVPRTPRFAEATTVYSPIEPSEKGRSPFDDPPEIKTQYAQSKPSDVGFGYISEAQPARNEVPMTPASPLKSAMRMPGAPPRVIDNPLSPTFREEKVLEKHEQITEKEQARDLIIKTRVRIAKLALRFTNFSCSLIVLAMLSTTMRIFYTTQSLPAENNLPAWANGTKTWPQQVVLATSCVSLAFCLAVFYGYWRGGHRRAEKTAVYYTLFAVGFFIFSIVMWGVAAGILQGSKSNSGNQDIWGWSCVDNKRRDLFQDKVDYALVCRLQSWSLICCLIEVVVETLTILIYGVIFYRYYSKRRLRKTMDIRDRARSDLYLAQLRTQTAPNTPGFGPLSPSYSTHMKSPRFPPNAYTHMSDIEEGNAEPKYEPGTRFIDAKPAAKKPAKPFALQPVPVKAHSTPRSPMTPQSAFAPPPPAQYVRPAQSSSEPAPVAPGEQQYESVPIPGAYAMPGRSSPKQQQPSGIPGQAMTSEHRIESPPTSPQPQHAQLRR